MSICPIFPPGPLVPEGACFLNSNNLDRTIPAFKKCCGPAPVAQSFNDGAEVWHRNRKYKRKVLKHCYNYDCSIENRDFQGYNSDHELNKH
ncbi:hypothetical protein Trisim1_009301 [Trichoderma cf. simile WF8]